MVGQDNQPILLINYYNGSKQKDLDIMDLKKLSSINGSKIIIFNN